MSNIVELSLVIITITLISKYLQVVTKVPYPISFIFLLIISKFIEPEMFQVLGNNFNTLMLMTIPLIIGYDSFHLKWKYIKEYYPSIIYLAVVMVALSIFIGTTLYFFEIFGPGLTIGAYIALFSINMATDAISVGAIFSQFKVPKNIRILAEGESLGNDATALIAFTFIGLPWIINNSFDVSIIPLIALKVFSVSILIGLLIGYFGFLLLKIFHEEKEEFLITVAIIYASFFLAEIFHVSGILSVIVSVVLFKALIDTELQNGHRRKWLFPNHSSTTSEKHHTTLVGLETLSYISILLVFVSVADLINVSLLLKYYKEILLMFFITTLIRMIMMLKFMFVGKKINYLEAINLHGWVILSLAGMKGALSILMVHSLPENYKFLEMFESITIGVIILSTFIYGIILFLYMKYYEGSYIHE